MLLVLNIEHEFTVIGIKMLKCLCSNHGNQEKKNIYVYIVYLCNALC